MKGRLAFGVRRLALGARPEGPWKQSGRSTMIEPHTGIILELGNSGKIRLG